MDPDVFPDQMLHPNLFQAGEFSPPDCSTKMADSPENAATMTELSS
jgi:hypothetical protein